LPVLTLLDADLARTAAHEVLATIVRNRDFAQPELSFAKYIIASTTEHTNTLAKLPTISLSHTAWILPRLLT